MRTISNDHAHHREDMQHPGDPRRRVRIHGDLEGLGLVLFATERGRKEVDDERQDEDAQQREHDVQHGSGDAGDDRHAEGSAHEREVVVPISDEPTKPASAAMPASGTT